MFKNFRLFRFIANLFVILAFLLFITDVCANPQIMIDNGAPECASCHTEGIFTKEAGQAGLAAYLASKTPTCTPPEVLQDNVCVLPPPPTCNPPQVLQNNECVTPAPTCTPPQVLQGNECVTPPLTCTAPQELKNDICVTPKPLTKIVRMLTSMGVIEVHLFEKDAPMTVDNFLKYVKKGSYNGSFFHRGVQNSVVQGGAFVWKNSSVKPIVTAQPVMNEFSASHLNVRGTIAMSKLNNKPDSATSQWFFNLKDNATFDNENGGYTVFGQVSEKSMAVIDAIGALPIVDASKLKNVKNLKKVRESLKTLPLTAPLKKNLLKSSNLVSISYVTTNDSSVVASDADRVFSYLEALSPELLAPTNPLSPSDSGSIATQDYYYRHYSSTHTDLFVANGIVYFRDANEQITELGTLLDMLALAVAAGY